MPSKFIIALFNSPFLVFTKASLFKLIIIDNSFLNNIANILIFSKLLPFFISIAFKNTIVFQYFLPIGIDIIDNFERLIQFLDDILVFFF